ncbi:MAG: hypothetical protein Q7T55_20405 [Solirubrobacteraceae bacterium]|nr:hypothetical protein [Solirubrobacteraceae bacterium]
MASKQPLYTVLGWAVWKGTKLYLKRRAKAAVPSKKVLALGVASVALAGVAASAVSAQNGND